MWPDGWPVRFFFPPVQPSRTLPPPAGALGSLSLSRSLPPSLSVPLSLTPPLSLYGRAPHSTAQTERSRRLHAAEPKLIKKFAQGIKEEEETRAAAVVTPQE